MGINIDKAEFDEPRDREGFRVRRALIGRQAGAAKLGASLWELPPGEAAYPYHFHLGEEELLFVLAGTPTLRDPEGERHVEEGDVLSFLPGEGGAHQLINRSDGPVRFLAISTSSAPDIVIYPDSNKVGCSDRRGYRELFVRTTAVDYWEGESAPG